MVRYIITIILILPSMMGIPLLPEIEDLVDQYILQDQLEIIQELRDFDILKG